MRLNNKNNALLLKVLFLNDLLVLLSKSISV